MVVVTLVHVLCFGYVFFCDNTNENDEDVCVFVHECLFMCRCLCLHVNNIRFSAFVCVCVGESVFVLFCVCDINCIYL